MVIFAQKGNISLLSGLTSALYGEDGSISAKLISTLTIEKGGER